MLQASVATCGWLAHLGRCANMARVSPIMRVEPEFRLFCLALRHPQQPQDAEALRRAIAASPDWKAIIAGARRHRVAPLILEGLRSCGASEIPEHALLALRQQAMTAGKRDLTQMAYIGRLMHAF